MKHSLFLIGDALTGDSALQRYIERHLFQNGVTVDLRRLAAESEPIFDAVCLDPDAPHTLFLFCDPKLDTLVAREVATFVDEPVTMHNELLMPASAHCVKTGYYTLNHRQLEFHVISAYTGHELPPLSIDNNASAATVHLFNADNAALRKAAEQIEDAFRVKCRLCEPVPGWIQCHVKADAFGDVKGTIRQLGELFANSIASDNIAQWLIEKLETANRTITFAESCTGGLISYFLTKENGASNVFEGALVTYSNRLKSNWIAVDDATLEAHGAVSPEVVEEMSAGALEVADADYAIAVSGIAGPTGGTPEKPVGTVHVAVRSKTATATARLQLHGDRNYIQEQTVLHAVKMLLLLDQKTFFQIY